MALTSGFYNSVNHDRKYDAGDISQLFDGLIKDGVFASIGTCFMVTEGSGLNVNVGVGRAWFNHTWTYNDAILPVTAPQSDLLLGRIDTLVLEVNSEDSVRANSIKFVSGEPASDPEKPELTNTDNVHQYPLCHITRTANNDTITQADIENMVGTDDCPFVTGVLEVVTIEEILPHWSSSLDQFVDDEKAMMDAVVKTFQEAAVQAGQGLQPATEEALGVVKLSDEIGINEHGQLAQNFIKKLTNITIGTSDWVKDSGTSRYTYTIQNEGILEDSILEVFYKQGTEIEPTYIQTDGELVISVEFQPKMNISIETIMMMNVKGA